MLNSDENTAFCHSQALRLGVFGYLGETECEEYADAILGAFDDRDKAKAAMDDFVCWDSRPLPAQIWHHARQQRGETCLSYCEQCDGTGFIPRRMVLQSTGATQFFADVPPNELVPMADHSAGVAPCSCRAGGGR